jgi:hypothetical protein
MRDILSNTPVYELLSMNPRDAKTELLEARNLLEQMYVEMDELETRIAKQKRVVAALTELADLNEDSEPPVGLVKGITDACKTAVLGGTKALYPSEVRDRIKALGFPEQKNLLASVHTVLKRLAEAGEIKVTDGGAYRRMTLGEKIAASGGKVPPDHPVHKLRANYPGPRLGCNKLSEQVRDGKK